MLRHVAEIEISYPAESSKVAMVLVTAFALGEVSVKHIQLPAGSPGRLIMRGRWFGWGPWFSIERNIF